MLSLISFFTFSHFVVIGATVIFIQYKSHSKTFVQTVETNQTGIRRAPAIHSSFYLHFISSDMYLFFIYVHLYRIQKKDDGFRHQLDLRGHRIFHSNPLMDCCPTTTHLTELKRAVNAQGVVLELFHTREFSQKFYETLCHKNHHNATCQFIDRRFRDRAKCRQQYSYVYALGRTYGNIEEDFKIDYVRVPSGCKCEVSFEDEFDGR